MTDTPTRRGLAGSALFRSTRSWGTAAAVVAIMWLLPYAGLSGPNLSFLSTAMTYVIVLLGLHIVFGLAGQVTLGPAAVFAIGAYAAGIADVRWHWSPVLTVVFAIVAAGAAGAVIGLPALRVSGFYLAMVTALAAQAIPVLANIFPSISGGQGGLFGISGLGIGHADLNLLETYRTVLVVVLIAGWITWNVDRSAWGRAFRAISANEVAAASMGIAVYRAKILAFVLSAALGGLAGGLYAHVEQVLDPSQFTFDLSILLFSALIIGGLGRPWGPILGIAIYVVGPYYVLPSTGGNWVQVVFGAALILVMVLVPGGAAEGISDAAGFGARLLAPLVRRFPAIDRLIGATRRDLATLGDPKQEQVLFARANATVRASVVLRAENVHVSFGGIRALQGAGLEVRSGQVIALIGPNGSGKTTLLNVFCGHAPIREGRIALEGTDVTGEAAHRRAASGLSRTFQTPINLGRLSPLENVLTGCCHLRPNYLSALFGTIGSHRRERAAVNRSLRLMENLGIDNLAKPGARASLTDGRLVEVARALALDPVVLLLDEPAAGLDGDGIRTLEQVIRKSASAGVGVLLVDHDVAFVRRVADHVVVLDQGQVIFEGPPSEVGRDDTVVAAYLGTPVE